MLLIHLDISDNISLSPSDSEIMSSDSEIWSNACFCGSLIIAKLWYEVVLGLGKHRIKVIK